MPPIRSIQSINVLSFLIDECLHPSLVDVAHEHGWVAHHIEHLGLKSSPDWELMRRALRDDAVFVTNNARDFLKLYQGLEIHAGLIVIVPTVNPAMQKKLFRAGLQHVQAHADLVNRVVTVDFLPDGINVVAVDSPWPAR